MRIILERILLKNNVIIEYKLGYISNYNSKSHTIRLNLKALQILKKSGNRLN